MDQRWMAVKQAQAPIQQVIQVYILHSHLDMPVAILGGSIFGNLPGNPSLSLLLCMYFESIKHAQY